MTCVSAEVTWQTRHRKWWRQSSASLREFCIFSVHQAVAQRPGDPPGVRWCVQWCSLDAGAYRESLRVNKALLESCACTR